MTPVDRDDIRDATNAYIERGLSDTEAAAQAIVDHIDELKALRTKIQKQIASEFEKEMPDRYKKISDEITSEVATAPEHKARQALLDEIAGDSDSSTDTDYEEDGNGNDLFADLPPFKATHKLKSDGTLLMKVSSGYVDEFGDRYGDVQAESIGDEIKKASKTKEAASKKSEKIDDVGDSPSEPQENDSGDEAYIRRNNERIAQISIDEYDKLKSAIQSPNGLIGEELSPLRKTAYMKRLNSALNDKNQDNIQWAKGLIASLNETKSEPKIDSTDTKKTERTNKSSDDEIKAIRNGNIPNGLQPKYVAWIESLSDDRRKELFSDDYSHKLRNSEYMAWAAKDSNQQEAVSQIEYQQNIRARSNSGDIKIDEFKSAFESLIKNREQITAEISKFSKDKLISMLDPISASRAKTEKKEYAIESLYQNMVTQYFYIAANSNMMSISYSNKADHTLDYIDTTRPHVEAATQEDLDKVAKDFADSKRELEESKKRKMEGLKDPKTLDDFRNLHRAILEENPGISVAEARMKMTTAQRVEYDRLNATETRSKRFGKKEERKTAVSSAGQTVDGSIIETKHTKKGHDLFVVQLSERVSKEDYNTLSNSAKRLGGYYSSFRGAGAVPGFQFPTREGAQAFLELAGGNTETASELAKELYDVFQDNKSQSTSERLRSMASAMMGNAEQELTRDRKANTTRRAGMAARALESAEREKAMAETMQRIAEGIESGDLEFLDKLRTKAQLGQIQAAMYAAKGDELRTRYPDYSERIKHEGEPITTETVDHAAWPTYTAFRSDLAKLARQMIETDGLKLLGRDLLKVADDTSAEYTKFAKENLDKVSTFRKQDGSVASFKSKADAAESIERSGFSGKAIPLEVKRGENRIILSASESQTRGIWDGADKRIDLAGEFAEKLIETAAKKNRKKEKVSVPWQLETAYEKRQRFKSMGIETAAEFRAALREYVGLAKQPEATSKVKKLELAMVGRKNDGLDFFPTPQSIADEMIQSAEIQAGMRVLEPSAGMGHIADRIREFGAEPDVVEISESRRELLEAKGYSLVGRDFMEYQNRDIFGFGDTFKADDGSIGILRGHGGLGSDRVMLVDENGDGVGKKFFSMSELTPVKMNGTGAGYDRIIMNPPFSDRRDMEHVHHAYDLLSPGGRIVAIVGEGVMFGSDKKATEFRDWLDRLGATSEKLEEGTFNDPSLPVTTGANARMLVIDKPGGEGKTVLFSLGNKEPMYKNAANFHDEIKNEFLDVLAEDSSSDEVMSQIEELSPELKNVIRALHREDWLGFDYPSQALDAVFSGRISNYEVSTSTLAAIGRLTSARFGKDDAQARYSLDSKESPENKITKAEAQAVVDRISKNWAVDVSVKIAESIEDFPDHIKSQLHSADGKRINALFDPATSTAWINLSEVKNAEMIERMVFHEVYTHMGFRNLFGKEVTALMGRLYMQMGGDKAVKAFAEKFKMNLPAYQKAFEEQMAERAKAQGLTLDQYKIKHPSAVREANYAFIAEEVLAHMSEDHKPSVMKTIQELIGAIREWLRKNGFAELSKVSESDLRHLLKQSKETVTKGKKGEVTGLIYSLAGINKAERRALNSEMEEALRYSIGDDKNKNKSPNSMDEWDEILRQLDYSNETDTLGDDQHESILAGSSSGTESGALEDNALGFLSDALEGSAHTRARLLGRVRKTSDAITNELGGKAEERRRAKGRVGHFTGYTTTADIIEGDSFYPDGRLEVYVYGDEQVAAGLTDEPALTFVVTRDGELTVNAPTGPTFKDFKERGWARESRGKNGEIQQGWNSLRARDGGNLPLLELMPVLADVHARTRAWKQADKVGLKWSRSTGATGEVGGGRKTSVYFSLANETRSGGFSASGLEEKSVYGINLDWVVRKLQDKMLPLKKAQLAIKKSGGSLTDEQNAYMAEELFHGKTENDLRKMTERFIEPITKMMADNSIDQAEVDLYLWAKHAEERNIQIAKINPEMPDGGSGMTTAQAKQVLEKAKEEGNQENLEKIASRIYKMLEEKRKVSRYLAGDEMVDSWDNAYKFYVPLKGNAKDETGFKSGRGFDVRGKESLRALGRRTKPESPLLHAIKDTTETVIRYRKNEVGNALLNLIEANPNPDYWEVYDSKSPEFERKLLTKKGKDYVGSAKVINREDYFITKKNGKEYFIRLHDQKLHDAMKNLGPEKLNKIVQMLGGVTRFLSSMSTMYNPEFVVTNFSRDVQAAVINLQAEIDLHDGKLKGKEITARIVKDVPVAMRSVYRNLQNKKPTKQTEEWQKTFDEFRNDGANTGWFQMKDMDQQAADVAKHIKLHLQNPLGSLLRTRKAIGDFVTNANSAVENAIRLAVYKNAIEAGISRKQAASLAKNITVNFNRKGEIGAMMNSLYMFFNAAVQGTAAWARAMTTMKIDEKGDRHLNRAQKVAVGIMFASFGLAALNRSSAGEDDDGENFFDKVPDYEKERNIVIMKSMFGGEPGEYWKIPLPYGYNVFSAAAVSAEGVINGNKSIAEGSGGIIKSMLGAFSPIGIANSDSAEGTAARTLTPSVARPFMDIALNENFFGSPVYAENKFFSTEKPQSHLSLRSTNEVWKWLAEALNDNTGGSQYRSGLLDFSPDKMGYSFNYFMGGAGAFYSETVHDGIRLYQGREIKQKDIPFLRRVSGEAGPYQDQSLFYDRKKEIDQIFEEYKSTDDREAFGSKFEKELKLFGISNFTAKRLTYIRKQMNRIKDDEALNEKEKEDQLKPFEIQMKAAIDRFNKMYRESGLN
jgi:hypothetical protein